MLESLTDGGIENMRQRNKSATFFTHFRTQKYTPLSTLHNLTQNSPAHVKEQPGQADEEHEDGGEVAVGGEAR